ncbi:MAG TPA: ABC transporter permease [Burkholderiaceae bacterium]|nr:ABC transporter permease [Burkholderiaceae bacterium]
MNPQPLRPVSMPVRLVLGVAFVLAFVGLWALVTEGGIVSRLVLASPASVLRSGAALLSEHDFGLDIAITVLRVLGGFAIAAILAIPLGVAMGAYGPIDALLRPTIGFARYLPAAGFIPLLILWTGVGETQKLAMVFIAAFFPLVLAISAAVANTPRAIIEVAYTLGTNRRRILGRVLLPYAAPQIADILRQVLGWTWTYGIFAELIASSSGVGHMITESQSMIATDQIIFGILVIGVIALVVDRFFRLAIRGLYRWSIT